MDGWKICRTIDLQKNSPPIERLRVLATLSDRQAHHLEITVMDGDMPADLKGLLPWMSIILPGRMSLKKQAGEVKANVISVHLPRTCYAETGDVSVIVSLADESVQMQIPIYGCVLRVAADGTDTVIDEESVIPSISELLMQIDQMKSATREAVRAAERADHAVDGIDRKIFGATLPKVDIEYGKNLINLNGNGKSGIYAFYPSGYCIESAEYRAIAIPVKGGEKVSFNQVFTNAHVVALSAIPDMTAVSAGDTLTGYIEGFANEARQGYVIPQSCKCLVVSIPINSASAAQCEYGEVSTAYSPYVEGINASKIIGGVLFVGDGYPYATIKDACDAAHDGDTIYIMPGTYKESVICYDKEVRIKGHSRDSVILTNDSGNYFTPPLYIAKGAVEDLTIAEIALEKDESAIAPAYCVHADSDLQEGHSLTFKNVCFTNKFAACVGIGLRSNFKISFQNCEFVSDEGYAVYLHESQYNGSRNQYAEFVDCVMQSTQAAHAICMQETPTVTESEALVRFQRCIVKSASNEAITMVQYGTQPGLTGSGYLGSSVWKLDALSADNSASEMNAIVFTDVSSKADKVSPAVVGNFAALDQDGNLQDSGKNANDFAAVGEIDALKKSKAEIDDTAIDGDTWSSKHIVDMLCPKVEKSGTLVQMDGMLGGYPLGVKVSWTPTQEGSGDPSPENIRPIKGRDSVRVERREDDLAYTLTLPSTVYGGEVDAVTGEGQREWRCITLTGQEPCHIYSTLFYVDFYKMDSFVVESPINSKSGKCSHHPYRLYGENGFIGITLDGGAAVYSPGAKYPITNDGLREWMDYLAAQYAAGTPVQICYKQANPVPFTATGGASIKALSGTNTVLTDADSVTVTGRADPIRTVSKLSERIAALEAAATNITE